MCFMITQNNVTYIAYQILYFPMLQICWNPNFGSHQWLAVAGQAGIVRLLYFEAVET